MYLLKNILNAVLNLPSMHSLALLIYSFFIAGLFIDSTPYAYGGFDPSVLMDISRTPIEAINT